MPATALAFSKIQLISLPIMPGSADKAFFPTHANIRPREASFDLTHSFTPPLEGGSGGVESGFAPG